MSVLTLRSCASVGSLGMSSGGKVSLSSDGGSIWGADTFLVADGVLGDWMVVVLAEDRMVADCFFLSFLVCEVPADFFLVPPALDLDKDFLRLAAEDALVVRFLPDAFFVEDFFFVFLATWWLRGSRTTCWETGHGNVAAFTGQAAFNHRVFGANVCSGVAVDVRVQTVRPSR